MKLSRHPSVSFEQWRSKNEAEKAMPPNKRAKIFTEFCTNFRLFERRQWSDWPHHWLSPPEQNSWLRYCFRGTQFGKP